MTTYVHRIAFERHHGVVLAPGDVVMHRCDTRVCVNPDHLMIGTITDNIRDMVSKGRNCRGSASHNSRHTEEQIASALRLVRDQGLTPTAAARAVGASPESVRRAYRGLEWKHVQI